jgi:uncharacterized protein (DUF433 family)
MSTAIKELSYPYITSHPDVAGGAAIIEGTRTTIRTIAGYYQMGMSVDEILSTLSHLSASQVHSALAYYFDHQQEIDSELAEYADEDYWKQQAMSHPKQKEA